MFLDKLFGNTFGVIWLVVLLVAILVLLIWLFAKKDKVNENVESSEVLTVEEEETLFEEEKTTEELNEVNNDVVNSDYEILAGEDGFFRVRKKGSERTLRKFATELEAIDFIEKKRA